MYKLSAINFLLIQKRKFTLYAACYFFFFVSSAPCFCQHIQIQVTGPLQQPVEFATVLLNTGDSASLKSLLTDNKGTISFSGVLHTTYKITVTYIGLQSFDTICILDKNISFTVKLLSKQGQAVIVAASAPVINYKAGKYIVNIENSFLAAGYSAFELLQKSPGIIMDNSGIIRLRGNKPIQVMVNNVVQRMTYEELDDYLKNLRSENVSKIEVITNPGAEFDAETTGGLVNIILKRPKTKGIQGSFSNTYRQQEKWPMVSPAASFNYKSSSFSAYASGSYTFNKNSYRATNNVIYPDKAFYDTYTGINEKRERYQLIAGLLYNLTGKSVIGIQNTYSNSDANLQFNTNINSNLGSQAFTGLANVYQQRSIQRNSTVINYNGTIDTFGSVLNIVFDRTLSKSISNVDFMSNYSNTVQDSIYKNFAPYKTNIYTGQVDYTIKKIKKVEIKAGIKMSVIKRDNTLITENFITDTWVTDTAASNNYRYTEKIVAAYISVNKSFKAGTEVSVGVRGEQTWSKGTSLSSNKAFNRKYFNLFPAVNLEQVLNKKRSHSLYISFNMPFARPDFAVLNPYRLKTDNFNYQIGNPALKPQTGYSFEIGVTLLGKYNMGIFYTLTKKVFATIARPVQNNIIEYQVQNFDNSKQWGAYATVPVKINKVWSIRTDVQCYDLTYRLQSFRNNQVAFYIQNIQTISIPKWVDVDVVTQYRSPSVYSNAKTAYQYNTDIGFSRKIIKGKARLRLLVTDITNSIRDRSVTNFNATQIFFFQKRPTRTFGITFSYSFIKGIKFNAKGVNQISNEEKNRLDR